jgi:asparagine synthase (glutamine-hydrolysing)
MCGIFGAVRFGSFFRPEEFNQFVALTDLVSYRGPDDSSYLGMNSAIDLTFELGNNLQPFDVFLGHRRLSIIDLSSAGRQPMPDGKGRWIVFNGEIFNFVELREELKSLGSQFQTGTDTEVILHLYDKFGESGFTKMNGMWALAIADFPARRVILSRDRFSIKPLYLLANKDGLFFASEIKQLLPLLSKKEPNLGILSNFIAQGLLDHSLETFFCEITKVPAKMNLVVHLNDGRVEQKAYWEYRERECPSLAQAREEFRELLIDSTRIRLRSDVKVGLLLSGGLDSSALAVAARLSGAADLETYSVVTDDERFSEEPYIDSVNQSLGLRSIKFRFQLPHLDETLSQVLHHSDEPFGGLSVIAQYGMFRTIRTLSDATVLLSGQGGDEVLLGYLKFFFFHLRDLLRQGQVVTALSQFILSMIRRTVVRQFRLSEAKRYMPFFGMKNHKVLRGKYAPVHVWADRGMQSRQIADIDEYSVPALTHYEDRNSMAHSLEVRHPFLDHRVVDLALSFPPEHQFVHGWTKNLLRESFPELPRSVRWRKDKQGFTTPEEKWLKYELTTLIENTFQKSLLDELGLLDSKAFLRQYSAFRRGDPLVSFGDISRAFIAESWAQQHWN